MDPKPDHSAPRSARRRGKNKEGLCDAGLELVYRQGFAATGVQEITAAAGVPKGSFYNYFDSKEDFAVQLIGLYVERACAHLKAVLVDGPGTPLARLAALYDGWIDDFSSGADTKGCFVANLTQEMATRNPTLRAALASGYETLLHDYTQCLNEAQEAGEIAADEDPSALAPFIYNAWQGAVLQAKAEARADPLRAFRDRVFSKLLA